MANERARLLRKNQTEAEKVLWNVLRDLKKKGFNFRRQTPIDHLTVDFCCLSQRLVIEVDGGQHGTAEGHQTDQKRDLYLASQGFRVLRFWNNDVLDNLQGVTWKVMRELGVEEEV